MVITWYQLGWIILSIFQLGVAFHFLTLYRMDKDKRKLMFGIAFLIGTFSVIYNATGLHNTSNESILLNNIYYWSFTPILIAIFSTIHHNLFNFKKFHFFFKSFIFFVILSLTILIIYPYSADETLSPIIVATSIEVLLVSLFIFIRKREISDFIFLLAVLNFTIGGMSTAMELNQYFQIFSFFMGYVLFLLLFSYPSSQNRKYLRGMGDIFALQKKLNDTEKTLQVTSERFHDLFEHIKSGVWVCEPVNNATDFVIKDINHAAEKIENISRDEVIGKNVKTVFPKLINTGFFDILKEVSATGISKHYPIYSYSDNLVTSWKDTMIYKLSTGEIVSVYDDITLQKNQEIELQRAHDNLKKLNEKLDQKVEQRTTQVNHLLKQKDNFINQLGHDLKNPLGPFLQLLPILKNHVSTEKDKKIVKILMRNAKYMQDLVKKTIELAKLNSEKTVFNFEHVALDLLVEDIILVNSVQFEKYELTIDNLVPPALNVSIDKLYTTEVFTNLFNNAIKYSNGPGKIVVDAKMKKNHVLVSIRDTGMGISEDKIDFVFDEYYKVDGSRHDFESSGLGLPICKRIIEKQGGKIWVESEGLGKGSTFYFTLPLQETEQNNVNNHLNKSYHEIIDKIDTIITK